MTDRTTPTRLTERVHTNDWQSVADLIAEVAIVHVGFCSAPDQPFVLPIAAAVNGADLLLHGSTGSRWLRQLATGIPVSAAVTAGDGLVVARSAFESSMHYRSAVLFGTCSVITGPAALEALDALTDALIPGRVAEVRRPTPKELAATLVLRLTVEEFSVKISHGWPEDGPDDVGGSTWAGVVPRVVSYGEPRPAPDLALGIEVPASVRSLR